MLRWTWLLLVFIGCLAHNEAKGFEPFSGSPPVAVLVQENPWAMAAGAETPRIAIYANGDVIYARYSSDQKREIYFYAKLDMAAVSSVSDRLRPVTDLADLKNSYVLSNAPNLGSARFYLRVDGREVVTSVYGLHPDGGDEGLNASRVGQIPTELRKLYNYLWTLQLAESRPWSSPYTEAMIWPFEKTPKSLIHWPKNWPDLKSDRVLRRGENYSIFLNGSQQQEVQKFLSGEKEDIAVEINGKPWFVSYRAVFPSEPVWRQAFSRVE